MLTTFGTLRRLGGIELGTAQLAILVGIGSSEPCIGALLHAQLAIGLVDEAILVHVHLIETLCELGIAGRGFCTADATILVGIQAIDARLRTLPRGPAPR